MPRTPLALVSRCLAATLLIGAPALTVAAQPADPAAEAQAIFTSVMSPYCPGLLLADCPSPAAFELRAEIRRRLDAGESRATIEGDLYRKFGNSIRAVPEPEGWGRVLWLAPALAFAVSLVALMWLVARSRAPHQPQPDDATLPPESDERLEEELDRLA